MRCMGKVSLGVHVNLNESCVVKGAALDALLLWRPRAGEAVTVCGAGGGLFRARVVKINSGSAELLVFEDMLASVAAEPDITLLQAMPEKERMELIIQKTTELGVSRIVPFKSAKSVSLEEREAKQKKTHKWQDVALKAAKQCRRAAIPQVLDYMNFEEAIAFSSGAMVKIALWERTGLASLKKVISDEREKLRGGVCILSGPEGGFEEKEMAAAKAAGFIPASLGPRILRAETAAIIAVGIVQYEWAGVGPLNY